MRVIVLQPFTKFEVVGLPVLQVWLILGHGVNRPGDLDLWLFDL